MPLLRHAVRRPLGLHGGTVEHARLPNSEIGHVDHFLDFPVSLSLDFADFEGDQGSEVLLLLSQRLADQPDEFSTFRGRDHPPGEESLNRFFHDALIVFGGTGVNTGNHLSGRRICRMQQRTPGVAGPPVAPGAASRIHGLDAQIFERCLCGAHRKHAPNSLARKSFNGTDSCVTKPWYFEGALRTRSITQQMLEAVVT